MPALAARTVWRIALAWRGTVLDVVTLDATGWRPRKKSLTLRTGDRLELCVVGDELHVDGAVLLSGETCELAAGFTLLATRELPEARVGGLSALDSTLFHAAMIGVAVQCCVVSALILAPSPTFDSDPGAGLSGEWRRYLVMPGGTAPTVGTATLAALGRQADEVERADPHRVRGRPAPSPTGKAMSAEEELKEMARVLQLGSDGTELREAIGEVARATAQAPVVGAELGGLAPKDPTAVGHGNGLIGAGESKLTELLHRRIEETERKSQVVLKKKPITIPVSLADMSEETFTHLARIDGEGLDGVDPLVKEEISRAVHRRDNAVRSCYESHGLNSDHNEQGHLELTLTLNPDGHVSHPVATVSDPRLAAVAACVERVAGDWYLGDGLVDEPIAVKAGFRLVPHGDILVNGR